MVEKADFFAAAALIVGPPPEDRRGMSWGTLVGSKGVTPIGPTGTLMAKFGMGVKLLTLWEQMGRPGEDDVWLALAKHHITSNQRKDLSEIIYREYEKWYETETKIRAAAEAL